MLVLRRHSWFVLNQVLSVSGISADPCLTIAALSRRTIPESFSRIYNILKNLDGDDDDVITQEEFRTLAPPHLPMHVCLAPAQCQLEKPKSSQLWSSLDTTHFLCKFLMSARAVSRMILDRCLELVGTCLSFTSKRRARLRPFSVHSHAS